MNRTTAMLLLAMMSSMPAAATEPAPLKQLNMPAPAAGAKDLYGDQVLVDLTAELEATQADMRLMIDDFWRHYDRLQKRLERQKTLVSQRQEAIKFIRREGSQRYYTVKQGSLRAQMQDFRIALGLQTIRWAKNIPTHCDWMFDSSFKIDKSNPVKALESFFAGLPLLPQLHTKDNSATITALEVIKCD